MSVRPLRVEQALDLLPELDELAALRDALIDASYTPADEAWAGAGAYITVGRRVADLDGVEERLPHIIEQVRARTEQLYRHGLQAVRALAAGDPAAAARELVAAGEIEEAAWRLDAAESLYRRAAEVGRRPRDRRVEALALRRLARLARSRGDLGEALRLYRAGTDLSRAARDHEGLVVGCTGLGNVHVDQGRWEAARAWYEEGMEHVRDRASPEFLHLCNALSVVERRTGRYEESERWLRLGESAASDASAGAPLAYLWHGRARLHLAKGEPELAEALLRRMVGEVEEPIARIAGLINLAEPLLLLRRADEALECLREAEDLALRYRAHAQLAYAYEQMGRVAAAREDPEGFVFFEQALELVRRHRLPPMQKAEIQHAYGLYRKALGAADEALARLRLARKGYRAVGATVDAERVGSDIDDLVARRRSPGKSGAAGNPRRSRKNEQK